MGLISKTIEQQFKCHCVAKTCVHNPRLNHNITHLANLVVTSQVLDAEVNSWLRVD